MWSTSNENIATVTGGEVEGKAGGTATITAACGEESVHFYCKQKQEELKQKSKPVWVTWSTGNANVVTVSDGGLVTRVGKGTTTVTAAVPRRRALSPAAIWIFAWESASGVGSA